MVVEHNKGILKSFEMSCFPQNESYSKVLYMATKSKKGQKHQYRGIKVAFMTCAMFESLT